MGIVQNAIVEAIRFHQRQFRGRMLGGIRGSVLGLGRMTLCDQRLVFRLFRGERTIWRRFLLFPFWNEKENVESVADEDAAPQLTELAEGQNRTGRCTMGGEGGRFVQSEKYGASRVNERAKRDAR